MFRCFLILETIRSHGPAIWIVLISALMFFGSIVLAWLFVVRMPPHDLTNDYCRVQTSRSNHPVAGIVVFVCKNLFGLLVVICGMIMLFTPGQGVLFIFLGLTLIDFPRKKQLIRRMVRWRNTLNVINRIRRQAHQPPIEPPVHG
ncbi:MAG: PGPGW domain-containing protein [Fuerstiella sp.]